MHAYDNRSVQQHNRTAHTRAHKFPRSVSLDIMTTQMIGQDEVCVLRVGWSSRIKMDSQIFLSGPSFDTCRILIETFEQSSCTECFVWWRPKGVSSLLFFASLMCSLYLSLTDRRVSPTYTDSPCAHSWHSIWYTTFFSWHLPRRCLPRSFIPSTMSTCARVGVLLHVRSCRGRFQISRTARPIALKFGTQLGTG